MLSFRSLPGVEAGERADLGSGAAGARGAVAVVSLSSPCLSARPQLLPPSSALIPSFSVRTAGEGRGQCSQAHGGACQGWLGPLRLSLSSAGSS